MLKEKSKRLLSKINDPSDLKSFSLADLTLLSKEIRELLIGTISKNGGHLASNLGVVDLTLALHYVYNSPKDKIIFDVGHQAYTHKIVTGRAGVFSTLRKYKGLSGYLKLVESKHDVFGAGHVGTAVSAALGMAEARDLLKEKNEVVAIVGDGGLTNGMTFEGLNNVGNLDTNITIVLNDNKWSISRNVGGIAKYLEKLSSIRIEEETRTDVESIFRSLGFTYFGPIDGHDIGRMVNIFRVVKETSGPKLVHVITKKGNGYIPSEINPDIFHMTNPFLLESGKTAKDVKNLTYTKSFGNTLLKIAKKNKRLVAITAAMPSGTGVDGFAKTYPERFFDVGIAEEHAVTFAAGLALNGFKPVVAIYSTFLQRAYDQILHDVALQKIPVIFAIDRAGIVGADGPTHHGLFDLSYLRNIPNLTLLAPKDENELQHMFYSATFHRSGPVAIRYPRGTGVGVKIDRKLKRINLNTAEKLTEGDDVAILAIGSMVYPALEAGNSLNEKGINASIYNAKVVSPIDEKMVLDAAKCKKILTVEENVLNGGFGSAVLEIMEKNKISDCFVKRMGIAGFVEHGEADQLKQDYNLTPKGIFKQAINLLKRN